MKRIAIIALIALTMIGFFAANQTALFAETLSATEGERMQVANDLYEGGQVLQAAQAYQQLVDLGVVDSALFYNLGNAHFKQGDYGRAIVNYRRAQQLAPRDPDVESNLALARAQAVDQFEVTGEAGFLEQMGGTLRGWLTVDELALAALAAWILFVFVLLLFLSASPGTAWRKVVRSALIVVAVLLVVGVLALGSGLYVENGRSEAVIVAREVDVISGPGAQYVTEFTLHDGAEVDLVEAHGNWVRLSVPGAGLEGWVPASAIEPVDG
jgi:hypothetical protein